MAKISVNYCVIGGNITRDPESRYTPKGIALCEFGVAVNRKWKSETGEEKEEVSFINCTAWGKTAETIAQYFRKGSPILVMGRLKMESWEDRDTGKPRQKHIVIVERFNFIGDSNREDGGRPVARSTAGKASDNDTDDAAGESYVPQSENDDVPF